MSTFALMIFAASLAGDLQPADAQCRVIHFNAQGVRTETPPTAPYDGPRSASASISSGGHGSVSTSVSASSSSSSRDGGKSSTTVSRPGRSITRSSDGKGCTVVIDDRIPKGEN